MLYKTAIVLLGLLLVCGLVLVMNASNQASALSSGQWTTVKNAIDGFITGQYDKGPDGLANTADDPAQGEAGFTMDRTALKNRIDTSNNWDLTAANAPTQILGEGDDAAGAPVLVDNLRDGAAPNGTTLIPGTAIRCNWASGYGVSNCLDSGKVTQIAAKVDAHQAAGFSTDIVVYCATARTESTAIGGLGPVAQTGALGGGATHPKVIAFKWGRAGWTGTATGTSMTTGTTGPAGSTSVQATATNPTPCNSYVSDADVVRCTAQWATYNGAGDPAWGGNGYNASNGITTAPTTTNQVIDIREPSPASTMTITGGLPTVQIPASTMFNTGLQYVGARTSATKNVLVGRTHMLPLIEMVGLNMLGYNSTAYVWGVNSWNTSLGGESYPGETPAWALIATTAGSDTTGIDQTAPTITSAPSDPGNITVTTTTASIRRVTNEPATSKLEITGLPTDNSTVLNADKTTTLTGLTPNTTYTGTLTVYDGQANGTSVAVSFTTACASAKPNLTVATHEAYWASYADYLAHSLSVVLKVTNAGTTDANAVTITGSTDPAGVVTLATATPIALGGLAPGATASTTVVYNVGSATHFYTNVTGSATDVCGTTYTYPV